MYFINKKIVKSIANEIYRDAGFTENDNRYVIYESDNQDYIISFTVNREMPDDTFKFKHFTICFIEDDGAEIRNYSSTNTLNRRELADKLLEIIEGYEVSVMLKEVS